jgi:hypothetical protein
MLNRITLAVIVILALVTLAGIVLRIAEAIGAW